MFSRGTSKFAQHAVTSYQRSAQSKASRSLGMAQASLERSISRYWLAASAIVGTTFAFWSATKDPAKATLIEEEVEPPNYPFPHNGYYQALDHFSLRRGFQVYMEVTNACHPIKHVYWRHLVDSSYTQSEVTQMAKEFEVMDGPDDEGEMFERTATRKDPIPRPYANEKEARYMNGGALPPDLSYYALTHPPQENYIFGVLTGYVPPPLYEDVPPKLYYNMYFEGGWLSMPPPLRADMVEYEDGTPASISQMAKDVSTFLRWTADPFHDWRKKACLRGTALWIFSLVPMGYWKKFYWVGINHRRASFVRNNRATDFY